MIIAGLPPSLLRAGLRYQLRHRWQALLALAGIVMGVAVVLAVDLANDAARASFALTSKQLQGSATHRIVGAAGDLADSVYRRLFTTPGHPPMAPVIDARIRVEGQRERMRLIGVDLFAERDFRDQLPGLVRGRTALRDWLTQPGSAAISTSAAEMLNVSVNSQLTIVHQGRSYPLLIAAIGQDSGLGSRKLIVVDIATAQAVTGLQGRLSHIDLILDERSKAWISKHLPASVQLQNVAAQSRNTSGLSAAFELNLSAMGLLALMVGMFLIFNAMSFSVMQRRNLLGRLRALGVRDRELAILVLIEALVLALLGTLIGTLVGFWLGTALTGIVAATVSEFYYDVSADAMHLSWPALTKAWGLGITGTLLAAWIPARLAARTPALTTMSRAALEASTHKHLSWLSGFGATLVALGLLIVVASPGGVATGFLGLFILLLGAALMTPMTLRLSHHLLNRLRWRGIWQMVVRDLDRHLSRLSTAAAALMVALAASVGVAVMVESMRDAVSDWLQDSLSADLYVAAAGFEDGATLPAEVTAQVPQIAEVLAYSSYRKRVLNADGRRTILISARLADQSRRGFKFVDTGGLDPWAAFDRGELLISEPLADRLRLAPGDPLPLPTDSGVQDFQVAAVFRDFASEHGRIFIRQHDYRRHWQDPRVNTLALFGSGIESGELMNVVQEHLSGRRDLVFTAAREIYDESMAVFERTFRITEVLRWLSVLVAFIGVMSALMALQLERRKEYAILRALGLTRAQVARLIATESMVLGLLAALLAIPTGLTMAWILTSEIQLRAFGWSMPFLVTASPLVWALLTGVLAAALAAVYPAWQSAAHDPAPQLREE